MQQDIPPLMAYGLVKGQGTGTESKWTRVNTISITCNVHGIILLQLEIFVAIQVCFTWSAVQLTSDSVLCMTVVGIQVSASSYVHPTVLAITESDTGKHSILEDLSILSLIHI